jgi:hypothetical protein
MSNDIKKAQEMAKRVNEGQLSVIQAIASDALRYTTTENKDKLNSMLFMGYLVMYINDDLRATFLNYFDN